MDHGGLTAPGLAGGDENDDPSSFDPEPCLACHWPFGAVVSGLGPWPCRGRPACRRLPYRLLQPDANAADCLGADPRSCDAPDIGLQSHRTDDHAPLRPDRHAAARRSCAHRRRLRQRARPSNLGAVRPRDGHLQSNRIPGQCSLLPLGNAAALRARSDRRRPGRHQHGRTVRPQDRHVQPDRFDGHRAPASVGHAAPERARPRRLWDGRCLGRAV